MEFSLVRKWLDTFWRQPAKQHWILEGDRNTKFFTEWLISGENLMPFEAFVWMVCVLMTFLQ